MTASSRKRNAYHENCKPPVTQELLRGCTLAVDTEYGGKDIVGICPQQSTRGRVLLWTFLWRRNKATGRWGAEVSVAHPKDLAPLEGDSPYAALHTLDPFGSLLTENLTAVLLHFKGPHATWQALRSAAARQPNRDWHWHVWCTLVKKEDLGDDRHEQHLFVRLTQHLLAKGDAPRHAIIEKRGLQSEAVELVELIRWGLKARPEHIRTLQEDGCSMHDIAQYMDEGKERAPLRERNLAEEARKERDLYYFRLRKNLLAKGGSLLDHCLYQWEMFHDKDQGFRGAVDNIRAGVEGYLDTLLPDMKKPALGIEWDKLAMSLHKHYYRVNREQRAAGVY